MSGAEIVGLISGTIAIVDAIVKVHVALQDASGLPSSFREVGRRMPLLRETLRASQRGLEEEDNEDSYAALKQVLESCKAKVVSLEKIFREAIVTSGASRQERYAAAVRTLTKTRQLEKLMNEITDDMGLLTTNYAVNAATRSQAMHMIAQMQKTLPPSSGENLVFSTVANYGIGAQHIHSGNGDRIINTGSGPQFSGTFEGSFHFHS